MYVPYPLLILLIAAGLHFVYSIWGKFEQIKKLESLCALKDNEIAEFKAQIERLEKLIPTPGGQK